MKFKAVKDPATGRIDMIPHKEYKWGERLESQIVRDIFGNEKYARFYPERFDGKIKGIEDLHDAVIIDMASMITPHTEEKELYELISNLADAAALVRRNILKNGVITFRMNATPDHDDDIIIMVSITTHEITITEYDMEGEMGDRPIVYWIENGEIRNDSVPYENMDESMFNASSFNKDINLTGYAIAVDRKQKDYAPNVIDIGAYRLKRYAAA